MLDKCYVSFHSLCMRVWSPIQESWNLLQNIYFLLKYTCKRLDWSKSHTNILSIVKLSSLIASKDGSTFMKFISSYCKFIINMKEVSKLCHKRMTKYYQWLDQCSFGHCTHRTTIYDVCLHHLKVALVRTPRVEEN